MKKWITLLLLILVGAFLTPKPSLLEKIPFSQRAYDDEGHLLRITLASDEKYRVYTSLSEISSSLIEATVLEEDRYFYQHPGFNPFAMIKAAWKTYVLQTRTFGASTITMQLARMRFGINSKTISGKIWQLLKALQLELHYSKKDILEAYFNLASYGSNIEGVGAASIIYFGKAANLLNLTEALGLSVIPQNPNRRMLRPINQQDFQKARNRLFESWIAEHPEDKEKKALMLLPLQLEKKNLPFKAPHFVDRILQKNREQQSITTSLNLRLQTVIEKVVNQYLEQQQIYNIDNAAVMLVDTRTMQIRALMGSGDYFNDAICGQVNGTRARRSPGSTLKPLIYALAMEQGLIHPYTVLKDAPTSFGDYNPENFGRDFLGPCKAKDALILSRNIPAVFLAKHLKNPTLHQFLKQARVCCLKPEQGYGLSMALGGAEVTMEELVCLYAMLANGGLWRPLNGQTQTRLLSPEASFLTLDMLRDTPRPYPTNVYAGKQLSVYWKTGTSSGYRDAWSIGIFGPYVLAVWIGDFNGKSNPAFVGTTAAAPLFFTIIEAVTSNTKDLLEVVKVTPEMNLTKVEVCEASGHLSTPCCVNTVTTWFIPGKSPIKRDTIHREIAIDNKTGLRTCHIDQDTRFEVFEFWPTDLLKIFEQLGVKRRVPPPFNSHSSPVGFVEDDPPQILSPQQELTYGLRLSRKNSTIVFVATASSAVQKLFWFVDQDFVGSCSADASITWKAACGYHIIRVVDDHGRSSTQKLTVKTFD